MTGEPVEICILKHGVARRVRLERAQPLADGAGGLRVVKRFESAGLLAGRRDASRARCEHRLLVHLHAQGLPVPRPLGLERRGGAWEVAMEWIPDAQTLQEVLLGRAPWPVSRERLAVELGRLLARLHAAGVDHPDLHPGNVLLDSRGRVWAIDFHKARLAARLGPSHLEAHLTRLAQGTREFTPVSFRLRFLSAWRRAYGSDKTFTSSELHELARRIDERARKERFADVAKRRLRWTREGTAVRAVDLEGGEGYERTDRESGLARALQASLEREGTSARRTLVRCPGDSSSNVLVLQGGAWRSLCATWYAAARLEEHGLSAARPLALARGPRPWAALELPIWGRAPERWDDLAHPECVRALGALAAALHDRGLGLVRLEPGDLWCDGRGRLLLTVVPRLTDEREQKPAHALRRWMTLVGGALKACGEGREALVSGFLSSYAGDRRELERAVDELRRG